MSEEEHGEKPTASGEEKGARRQPPGTGEEYTRRAEERFIDDLIARGAAVPEGEELPPGATHVISYDEKGRRTVRRVRFAGHPPPGKE